MTLMDDASLVQAQVSIMVYTMMFDVNLIIGYTNTNTFISYINLFVTDHL